MICVPRCRVQLHAWIGVVREARGQRDHARNRASEAGSRYDEMVIAVGTTFHFRFGDAAPRMSLSLRPLAGIVLAGRMGFEGVQNLIHDTFGIERVFLSYERAGISIYPKLGFVQSFDYLEQAPWFSSSDLVFRVETDGSFSPGYAHRFHAGFSVGQRTQAISELLVGIGYTWESVEDGWPSHELVGLSESGLTAMWTDTRHACLLPIRGT